MLCGQAGAFSRALSRAFSQDPAGFCARADLLQRLAGSVLDLACPPVLWVSNGIQEGRAPDTPLWWAGGAWHHFPKVTAYVPRTFEPSWHSVLSQPLRCLEPAPGELKPSGEVFQVHRVLLCGRTEGLWSRPSCGGAWSGPKKGEKSIEMDGNP